MEKSNTGSWNSLFMGFCNCISIYGYFFKSMVLLEPVQKLPNLVRVCDEGQMRLATWGRSGENFAVLMRAREG